MNSPPTYHLQKCTMVLPIHILESTLKYYSRWGLLPWYISKYRSITVIRSLVHFCFSLDFANIVIPWYFFAHICCPFLHLCYKYSLLINVAQQVTKQQVSVLNGDIWSITWFLLVMSYWIAPPTGTSHWSKIPPHTLQFKSFGVSKIFNV